MGTGGGHILIFSYDHDAVINIKEATQALVRRRKCTKGEDIQNLDSLDGGLLSSTAYGRKDDGDTGMESPQGGWVVLEGKEKSESDKDTQGEEFMRRRKTQFGRTLRNKSYKRRKSMDLPDIYSLKLQSCSDPLAALNESVRVLLPVR